jgi:hypothetical protein
VTVVVKHFLKDRNITIHTGSAEVTGSHLAHKALRLFQKCRAHKQHTASHETPAPHRGHLLLGLTEVAVVEGC